MLGHKNEILSTQEYAEIDVMSASGFARRCGVSRQAIHAAAKTGRVHTVSRLEIKGPLLTEEDHRAWYADLTPEGRDAILNYEPCDPEQIPQAEKDELRRYLLGDNPDTEHARFITECSDRALIELFDHYRRERAEWLKKNMASEGPK